MKKISVVLFVAIIFHVNAFAQYEYVQEGEFGLTVGAGHYFGDLNNRAAFNRPKIAVGFFLRKQFGNYT
ncbi:MAG: hypothetical protein ABIR19_03175, partial [Ginsengibacter sp.]